MLLNYGIGEDSWESLGLQGDQTINSKGNLSWLSIGMTDAEAEAPILWPPDVKNWHIRKDPDAGKDWSQEEKGTTEDEMAGWHHGLDGRESEWTLGVVDGQGAWRAAIPGVTKSWTRLSNWTEVPAQQLNCRSQRMKQGVQVASSGSSDIESSSGYILKVDPSRFFWV